MILSQFVLIRNLLYLNFKLNFAFLYGELNQYFINKIDMRRNYLTELDKYHYWSDDATDDIVFSIALLNRILTLTKIL